MTNILYRPPIVAILGHVDHGKTSLLDYIRKSRLTNKEHGGITQKIGAYEIDTNIKGYHTSKITFIDTPGHEAFSKIRARGSQAADIAILLIDAKDSVMPQTVESISHIKAAKIPFIVALNKIDLPEANPEKIKNDLLKYEVQVEGKGGEIPMILLSAKTGKGVDELLESILLLTSDLNLKYSPNTKPEAIIIETKKDKRGIVISAIIKDGILKIGDQIVSDDKTAKIRSIFDDTGETISSVVPTKPFEMLGFSEFPGVGSIISLKFAQKSKQVEIEKQPISSPQATAKFDLDLLLHPKKEEKKLSLIIKADLQGSLEAINQSLTKNKNVEIILQNIGEINNSDVFLAKSTQSIIIGFSVNISNEAKELAKQERVIIKTYDIIYNLLDELNEVSELLKEKQKTQITIKGEAKILASFVIEDEKVSGVKILKGKISLDDKAEIYRENNLIGKTKLVSLKVRAKKVTEVKKDQEAGMIFSPQLDIRVGDVVKFSL